MGEQDRYEEALDCLQDTAQRLTKAEDELAELRALMSRTLTVYGIWPHEDDCAERCNDPIPARIGVTDDGDDVELTLDAMPLITELLRRQAKAWCQAADGDGPPLEALLAMVPPHLTLEHMDQARDGSYSAAWHKWPADEYDGEGRGPTREAAIRAATLKLLGGEGEP